MMRTKSTIWLLAGLILIIWADHARTQEHPREHPSEHPTAKSKGPALTMDAFAKAADAYIKRDSELKGGYFLVYDPDTKRPLALTLDKVHRDKLSQTGDQEYFACADFKAADGTMYDLDIFMTGTKEADLKATDIAIHKVNGKPRYTWYEDGGIWKKKPVTG